MGVEEEGKSEQDHVTGNLGRDPEMRYTPNGQSARAGAGCVGRRGSLATRLIPLTVAGIPKIRGRSSSGQLLLGLGSMTDDVIEPCWY